MKDKTSDLLNIFSNLVRLHFERNDEEFLKICEKLEKKLEEAGFLEQASYIAAILNKTPTFSSLDDYNERALNGCENNESSFLQKINIENSSLLLPEKINSDVLGILNAVKRNLGVTKFLFKGCAGTGKTETVKHIARLLNKELFVVDFTNIIDSYLGKTPKNINALFEEIENLPNPNKTIILFDEIDAIALDRVSSNDNREMGRTTSTFLKRLERLNSSVLLFATTNLYEHFDKALIRRFDAVIDFNRYSKEDLLEIALSLLDGFLLKFKHAKKNTELFKKIILLFEKIPYPADLKNIIKTSLAFSVGKNKQDYLRVLYKKVVKQPKTEQELKDLAFTEEEIKIIQKS